MNELYQTLGVAPTASADEIKKAYRKLAKELHPDLHPDDPQAESRIKAVNQAYEILSSPEKRNAYDAAQRKGAQTQKNGQTKTAKSASRPPTVNAAEFVQMQDSFAQFFGFDPHTGKVVDEEKVSGQSAGKNPLDVSDLFDRFMGFK